MTARIIDGKAAAAELRAEIGREVAALKAAGKPAPGLHVVLVGEDPASKVYVASKEKLAAEIGMNSVAHRLPAETTEAALLAKIAELNADDGVDGILVQLPLPKHIDTGRIIDAIDPAKDVDGLHPINAGLLAGGKNGLVPCTPLGCMLLLKQTLPSLSGLEAVVIGRSELVGRPVAQLLLQADCTVTIAHSRTRDLPAVVKRADIVVAAVGRPRMVKGDWIKPGATVIDVGINRMPDGKLAGDVDYAEAAEVAGAITPVPGGVGPTTIACLLRNTLTAYRARRG
ncbi:MULTISPECIES: bifunctional methylenetetrahydrofolate dehydrogenase/methenyltetrahydrofolate cyclohydrolase FolD [unclassified Bosea (in: a-proteobacteria)]|uniref:bifunctional methylenetetrahydrofolate dehydrogenase/methenyltetrahydrofolate cyclohydrolase FolD n=1 Tax=unclassified Bosea (in: a-proteobacteria) TaxID=2653178 RepID=UPI000F75C0DE|nr:MULTISPECIES: bifunctional methylenetetrahydrofolate dehydrogenase/methenyltetrahydrofolate cyclohydrolase FolD [unclassified Bosea (in: a-proteobacteria)]AZO81768.1 bifunctional methylenetetrahydrofolate dehydrogenase/methenyltetrahydrofolate cyclohydrolase [Bosea sp. Tri-49]RXT26468.1 bifunctional methylenetetrahydrofolate dehydrogenase/methenyltetrahydrofolate cyclohydrolase [Bosea sp. Tri-39]RXT33069.1 bifunctional methylenetetrahydrofolate dehydrogenase/methenyltetrahydrofolate cyclohydr